MGIQVHRTLVHQHSLALGQLRKLIRQQAPHCEILAQQKFAESLAHVIDHQGIDADWNRELAVEPRPKRQFFPKGAYRRDSLNIMRKAGRPLRISEVLDELCRMHGVTLNAKDRAHAAIKLAQGTWALIQQGLVERVDKEADYRSAACLYVVKR